MTEYIWIQIKSEQLSNSTEIKVISYSYYLRSIATQGGKETERMD